MTRLDQMQHNLRKKYNIHQLRLLLLYTSIRDVEVARLDKFVFKPGFFEKLDAVVYKLHAKEEIEAIRIMFGLDGRENIPTRQQAAAEIGCDVEILRRRENRALRHLRLLYALNK